MTKIVLDLCNNHMGNRRILDTMIEIAASSAIDFVKFQLYNSDKLNPEYPNYEEYKSLCKECEIDLETLKHILTSFTWNLQMRPMFTIFSEDRLDLMEEAIAALDFNKCWPTDIALKIGSPNMSDYALIDKCTNYFPENLVLVSTGMHSDEQIIECTQRYKDNDKVKFLHCISEYPTDPRDIDWAKVTDLNGFSDHTLGVESAKKAIMMGAEFLEFHFTLSKNLPGKDHLISKDIEDMRRISRFRQSIINSIHYKARWNG